ncbi:hypothetical protein FACS1894170_00130 [Planctomycetales bacterium]|nr:hypothetical protein FACS1894170_00130 [Planctomycetales bacterium]
MQKTMRYFVWFSSATALAAVLWAGYFHLFGAGFFRPVAEVKELTVQLGEVEAGRKIPCEFTITNRGFRSLYIERVHPGCAGCIEAVSFPQQLQHNATGIIKVHLLTEKQKGSITKAVLVDTNDPVKPVLSLRVGAVVKSGEENNPQNSDGK